MTFYYLNPKFQSRPFNSYLKSKGKSSMISPQMYKTLIRTFSKNQPFCSQTYSLTSESLHIHSMKY